MTAETVSDQVPIVSTRAWPSESHALCHPQKPTNVKYISQSVWDKLHPCDSAGRYNILPVMEVTWRDRLKNELDARGISGREMSLRIGKSHAYIKGILNGAEPGVEKFANIAEELGMTVEELYFGKRFTELQAKLFQTVSRLDPEQRETALRIIESLAPPDENGDEPPSDPD